MPTTKANTFAAAVLSIAEVRGEQQPQGAVVQVGPVRRRERRPVHDLVVDHPLRKELATNIAQGVVEVVEVDPVRDVRREFSPNPEALESADLVEERRLRAEGD